MGILGQRQMSRLFVVTDELGIDREELVVPLLTLGEGAVSRRGNKLEITLPEGEMDDFLIRLPSLVADARA